MIGLENIKKSGMEGLENGKRWNQYSTELKIQAVKEVL